MSSKQAPKIFLLVILSFIIYYLLFQNFDTIKISLDKITHQGLISYVLSYLIVGIPIFVGTYFIDGKTNVFISLGLSGKIFQSLWKSILFVIPMFVGYLFFFKINYNIEIESLIAGTIVAGFVEELYFRGFLFGQIFRKTNFGFIVSIFFGALIFASGHLYQSQNISQLIGIFIITFLGAIFFAWLYVEWNFNLWIPIFTHALMNLTWKVFEVDDNALGGGIANVFRILTILTAIIGTILYKKAIKQKLIINKQTLIFKRK